MEIILPKLFLALLLHNLLFVVSSVGLETTRTSSNNETDRLSLFAFKKGITRDTVGILSSWNDSIHFCGWVGVKCGGRRQRVTVLDLHSQRLSGYVSPHIGNLTFLRQIDLKNNSFHGEIPNEIGNLRRLRGILLSNNSFEGVIPKNLSRCSQLQEITLNNNKIVGNIPFQLGYLSKLIKLTANGNALSGEIPSSFGNLSSLQILSLAKNNLEGSIPDDFGRLTSLVGFALGANKLSGMIPPSLYNISSLQTFAVEYNQLNGSLPSDMGLTLPNLRTFSVWGNQFTGLIPISLANASRLQNLYLNVNNFHGAVSTSLGHLKFLVRFILETNHLGSRELGDLRFLTSLNNCTNLELINISNNNFGGVLPKSLGNLSVQLSGLGVGSNFISGSIPTEIGNLINLDALDMRQNLLTGSIPTFIGSLHKLNALILSNNNLSGFIPSSFGNLTSISILDLSHNNLQENLPSSLGNLGKLQALNLSYNNLSGIIPQNVISLSSLTYYMDLTENSFSGRLQSQVGQLKHLGQLFLSNNKLSGKIPRELGECESLEYLYLDGNFFEENIPPSLNNLKGIRELDLSRNKLSGQVPEYMGRLSFQYLNLSFNDLEGELPQEGVFRNASAFSVVGNNKLCGGILEIHLPTCLVPPKKHEKRHLKLILPVIFSILLFILLPCFFIIRSRRTSKEKLSSTPPDYQHLRLTYPELLKATDRFSSANLIGVGSFGSVYKGVLSDDERVVAVKVLNLQQRGATQSFIAECHALRNIRHRNLVKIHTACSGIDFKGDDFKALVLDFMANGSLDEWLHHEADGQGQMKRLNLAQRLNIAIDVACALDYLHNNCQPPIVHRDLKPSNVLIHGDMSARVGDFGLAKFLISSFSTSFGQNETSSVAIKGSIGYIAPEYAVNVQASTHGDVYSYGIIILEMLTGKRPVDDMFKEGLNLHNFAKMALQKQVMTIIDPLLLTEKQNDEGLTSKTQSDARRQMQECLVSILKIGVACSTESLSERMDIKDVVSELNVIRELYLGVGIHGERQNRARFLGEGTSYQEN